MTLIEQIIEDQYELYVDLDGTLCDFEARYEHYTGSTPDESTALELSNASTHSNLYQVRRNCT